MIILPSIRASVGHGFKVHSPLFKEEYSTPKKEGLCYVHPSISEGSCVKGVLGVKEYNVLWGVNHQLKLLVEASEYIIYYLWTSI